MSMVDCICNINLWNKWRKYLWYFWDKMVKQKCNACSFNLIIKTDIKLIAKILLHLRSKLFLKCKWKLKLINCPNQHTEFAPKQMPKATQQQQIPLPMLLSSSLYPQQLVSCEMFPALCCNKPFLKLDKI